MCGIAGIINRDGRPVVAEEVDRMCAMLVHRGPDDGGTYIGDGAGLGMRRLSIIDLATGHQPISNEDGTVWVVFNGEIYNFRSLRQQLMSRGHRLATQTDTEVLVHLYEDFGADLVKHLRGMFAFALWDTRKHQLVLGRDRVGIKPLYYAEVGEKIVFASELKAVLQVGGVERNLDWTAVNQVATYLTTNGSQSIIRGVHKLEPGNVVVAGRNQTTRVSRYWDVHFEPDRTRSQRDFVEGLREKLDESVRLHMISDVPVGAFLSGGIDSSAVVANMVRHSDRRLKTFSIGFNEAAFNELPYARKVSKMFGTEHHELVLEPNVLNILEDLVWHLDEPFADSSAIPTYMVSRLAAQHVKVVLSGDGGDELFAGYDKYRVEERERQRPELPSFARKALSVVAALMPEHAKGRHFIAHHSLAGWPRYLDAAMFFRARARRALFHPDVRTQLDGDDPAREDLNYLESQDGKHWLSAIQYLDLKTYMPQDVLTKVDRMSMAHSLEVRVPILDHEVVEFAAKIPPELSFHGGVGKRILKEAMRGMLPDDVIDRPKRGFAVPLGAWFRGELEGFARELLLSKRCRERNVINSAYVEKLLRWHRNGRPLDLQLWTLISFEMWCRTFLDQVPVAQADSNSIVVGATA